MRWSRSYSILGASLFIVCTLALLRPAAQQQPALPSASPTPPPASSPTPTKAQPEFFVMIDPSHGGDDKGAVFSNKLSEKELTLSLARELRKELQDRGISARLLRDSDVNVSLERRAELCNQLRPALYVALHAGTPGSGVRVYAPLVSASEQSPKSFVPWESAQITWLGRSEAMARAVAQELQKENIKARYRQAFLRPLNNVTSPAIAIELAVDHGDVRAVESEKLRGSLASAVASVITQNRARPGERK